MTLPQEIVGLVERFDEQRESYRSGKYKEAQLRSEFLDPFFEALGWDVYNRQGYAEAYKDVIHEDAIKVGGATKAPDYCFRIGGTRKFFVEAKKPSVDIKEAVHPAYQLRRYAWSAKLPLSILTDFEEFAAYDCRVKPARADKASTARTIYLTFSDYTERWDEIASIFAKEAVLKGSFDKYVDTTRRKRGTAEVDDVFLKEIESWRDSLARNIALRNPNLTQRELNFAVQRTIDRIIFLRICEDRGIEHYGQLSALQNGTEIYPRLCRLFYNADHRYNSGLFHFRKEKDRPDAPDELTPRLTIDDKPLKDIVKRLYYPESPYEFSVLPADILGQVYEQFLGKVIRLTPAHHAVVEDKPEVKKAGGIYYTPTYIVDYIVKNTVGKLLGGEKWHGHLAHEDSRPRHPSRLTPGQVSKLRILDPACGSGSFLIGAYQYLLDWHRDWYVSDDPKKHARGRSPKLHQAAGGEWQLTTSYRKRILLNNIYGVDIDPQAVEVTKLSLLLKVLEGESEQTLERQFKFFHERALPDLSNNIKCGNSLIGPDFYDNQQMTLLDDEERYRINAFDWNAEFPHIMKSGGFHAVIGNPPYLRIQGLQEHYAHQVGYFARRYKSAIKRFDLYLLFAEKGFDLLCSGGRLGFICPHKFVNSDFGSGLRAFLLEHSAMEKLVSFRNNLVFAGVSTYTGILILSKTSNSSMAYCEIPDVAAAELPARLFSITNREFAHYALEGLSEEPWVLTAANAKAILSKLRANHAEVGAVFGQILVGVQSGIDKVHVLRKIAGPCKGVMTLFSEAVGASVEVERQLLKPFLRGEDVHRYAEPVPVYYCIYPYEFADGKTRIIEEPALKRRYPLGYSYLTRFRPELRHIRLRQKTNPTYWYSCHRPRDMRVFEAHRLLTPEISNMCNMTLGQPGIYHNTKVYSLVPSEAFGEDALYWLGVLNSKTMWWLLANTGYVLRGGYYVFKTNYLRPLPIPAINSNDSSGRARHDHMVKLVDGMLDLHKKLAAAKTDHDKTVLQRDITKTDNQIDQLVYELYGLTDEEIAIVEEATKA